MDRNWNLTKYNFKSNNYKVGIWIFGNTSKTILLIWVSWYACWNLIFNLFRKSTIIGNVLLTILKFKKFGNLCLLAILSTSEIKSLNPNWLKNSANLSMKMSSFFIKPYTSIRQHNQLSYSKARWSSNLMSAVSILLIMKIKLLLNLWVDIFKECSDINLMRSLNHLLISWCHLVSEFFIKVIFWDGQVKVCQINRTTTR